MSTLDDTRNIRNSFNFSHEVEKNDDYFIKVNKKTFGFGKKPGTKNSALNYEFLHIKHGKNAKSLEICSIEPDANTFHDNYYYNSKLNLLYIRYTTSDDKKFWKQLY